MTVKVIDATVLRANLGDVISEAKKGNIIEIRRRGKGEVAMIDLDLFEDWLAAQDSKYIKSIKQARSDAAAGKTVGFEDVYREAIGT